MGNSGASSGKAGSSGARSFQEVDDDSIFDPSVEKWRDNITSAELDATIEYTGSAYTSINNALRKDTGYYKDTINEIDKSISKFNLKQDIIVYRGVSSAAFDGGVIPEVGTILQDKGFMSTTVRKSVASDFDKGYILKINVPKGKGRGAYVKSISNYPNEHEFLMKRSSKLKVTGIASGEKEGFMGGQTVIYADLV